MKMAVSISEQEKAYKAVVDNTLFLEKDFSFPIKFKIFIYNLFMMCLCSYKTDRMDVVHVINGIDDYKKGKFKGNINLGYGKTFRSLSEFRKQVFNSSYISRKNRISTFLYSIKTYSYVKAYGGCYAYWLDFCMWNSFFALNKPNVIMANGHYDRLTTTLSELCNLYSGEFQIIQHGLLSNKIHIPHKIKCKKCIVFDEYEEQIFRDNIIDNPDCEYEIYFGNKIDFINADTNDNIGIIDAPFDNMREIVDRTIENVKGKNVYIMMHPLRAADYYKDIVEESNIHAGYDKIKNLDIVVSCPSTLAYDFIRNGFSNRIVFVDINHLKEEFRGRYSNLIYVDDYSQLVSLLNQFNLGNH